MTWGRLVEIEGRISAEDHFCWRGRDRIISKESNKQLGKNCTKRSLDVDGGPDIQGEFR